MLERWERGNKQTNKSQPTWLTILLPSPEAPGCWEGFVSLSWHFWALAVKVSYSLHLHDTTPHLQLVSSQWPCSLCNEYSGRDVFFHSYPKTVFSPPVSAWLCTLWLGMWMAGRAVAHTRQCWNWGAWDDAMQCGGRPVMCSLFSRFSCNTANHSLGLLFVLKEINSSVGAMLVAGYCLWSGSTWISLRHWLSWRKVEPWSKALKPSEGV